MEREIINSNAQNPCEGMKMPSDFESCRPALAAAVPVSVDRGGCRDDTTFGNDNSNSRIKAKEKQLPNGVIQHPNDIPKSLDKSQAIPLSSKCQDCDKVKTCLCRDVGLDVVGDGVESLCISQTDTDIDSTGAGEEDSSKDSGVEELAAKLNTLDDGAECDNSPAEASAFNEDKNTEVDILLGINYVVYESEKQMPDIMTLITKDLSEPYSIYTYRYFIHNWPKLCFLVSIKKQELNQVQSDYFLHGTLNYVAFQHCHCTSVSGPVLNIWNWIVGPLNYMIFGKLSRRAITALGIGCPHN
jgi:hypothetical protein